MDERLGWDTAIKPKESVRASSDGSDDDKGENLERRLVGEANAFNNPAGKAGKANIRLHDDTFFSTGT